MITEVDIGYGAVLMAAIVSVVIGMLWYSPAMFGKQWLALMGKKKEDMKGGSANKAYAISFVATLVAAYVLAHFVQYVGAVTVMDGIQLGFWVWLGFIGTVGVNDVIFGGKLMKLFGINTGFQLVSFAVMGAVLAMWG